MFSRLFGKAQRPEIGTSETVLGGAYRRHHDQDVEHFTNLACEAFPSFAKRIECFGADWLGNQFALDRGRIVTGRPQILLLEPGTGEALEIPTDLDGFYQEQLVTNADAAVALTFFQKWIAAGGRAPEYRQCVGYTKPLFLGGADEVSNLTVSDFDVYWSISAQLLAKVRGLPLGTRVDRVTID